MAPVKDCLSFWTFGFLGLPVLSVAKREHALVRQCSTSPPLKWYLLEFFAPLEAVVTPFLVTQVVETLCVPLPCRCVARFFSFQNPVGVSDFPKQSLYLAPTPLKWLNFTVLLDGMMSFFLLLTPILVYFFPFICASSLPTRASPRLIVPLLVY